MTVQNIRGNALNLPLEDNSVDLICTSPPYFGLRSYTDQGAHYDGQLGSEASPAEFVDALIAATAEMVRVVKPSGSIFVNLGDKYSQRVAMRRSSHQDGLFPDRPELAKDWKRDREAGLARMPRENVIDPESGRYIPEKSLMGLPWRYALRCIDDLGLILRAEIIWAKPNGLPESVTDRVRRSHEQWFHFTLEPRYYAAVDTIREAHNGNAHPSGNGASRQWRASNGGTNHRALDTDPSEYNPLGKLPGSVWSINEGVSLVRSVLTAVSEGGITVDEGERILAWTSADSSTTFSSAMVAGSGTDSATETDTAGTTHSTGQDEPTASPTKSSSAPSRTDSPSTISAGIPAASDRTTSSQSPSSRTLLVGPESTSASTATHSTSETPTSEPVAGASAAPASETGCESSGLNAPPSIWVIPTQPLTVPAELGVDHFAAFPMEWPRRIIRGWSPSGICTVCGQGRRPVTAVERTYTQKTYTGSRSSVGVGNVSNSEGRAHQWLPGRNGATITGEACGCETTDAPTRPAVVLDPFGGTGTTALVASALGRHGITIDMSNDYCRLAQWRCNDPGQLAAALQVDKPEPVPEDQLALFDGLGA